MPLLALLLAWLASAQEPTPVPPALEVPAAPDALPPLPPATAAVHLAVSGGSGGIGSGRYRFALPEALASALEAHGGALRSLVPYHGALAQGPLSLVATDGRVRTLLDLIGGTPTCAAPTPGVSLRTETEWLVLPDAGAAPAWLEALGRREGDLEPVSTARCTAMGAEALLIAPEGFTGAPDWALDAWEFRLALRAGLTEGGASTEAHLIGIPADEASRRVALLARLLEDEPQVHFVDGGDFVDGTSSVRDGALSLHRPVGFSVLDRLDPMALAPGRTELAGGARVFLEEARTAGLAYVATNWQTEDPTLALPEVLVREIETPAGSVRLAFLGLVDPSAATWAPGLAIDGVSLTDPVEAANTAIATLDAKSDPPDAVVVLTAAGPALLHTLRRELIGADLLLGDVGAETARLAGLEVAVRVDQAGPRPPLTLPVDGIATVELSFARTPERWALSSLSLHPHPVPADLPLDPEVRRLVGDTRAAEYPPLDHQLVPAPAEPTAALDAQTWAKVVCEAVLQRTGADVVFLPALPDGSALPGPLTELLTVDRLAMLDTLEVHRIPGDRMDRLLLKAYGNVPVHCGAPLGERAPKARGRPIEDDRVYRVASTDRARAGTVLGDLLAESYSPWALDKPGYKPFLDESGQPLTLRTAVLESLRALRDDPEVDDLVAELSARSPSDKPPMWLLRVRALSLSAERFQGAEDEAYASIPETLATSPSSLTLGGDLDVALDYSSARLLYDVRLRSRYTRLSTADDPGQETADDLKPSTSASLPGVVLPLPKLLDFMPYGEVFLDSELTRIETDGETLPRQADLWLTAGLSAKRRGILRALRLAGFGLRDLGTPDKAMAFGGHLEWETRYGFGPGLYWKTTADASVYGNTPDQDESDLRFKALVDTAVALPLARYLDISVFGRGFLFSGRVQTTSKVAAAWTLGFSLDVGGAFAL